MKSGRSGTGRAGRRAPRGRRSWVLVGRDAAEKPLLVRLALPAG